MTDDELEQRLHLHYRVIDPRIAPQGLGIRIGDALAHQSSRPAVNTRNRSAFLAALVAVAIVAVGLGLGLRPGGFLTSPGATPTATAQPHPSAPTPQPSSSQPSLPPSPSAASAAAADRAGTFSGRGLWVVRGPSLLISTDAGASWQAIGTTAPVIPGTTATVFVLDAEHAWSISPGPGTTELNGSPTDVLHLVIHRTADGGKTWQGSTVPGNFAGTGQSLVFADAEHGYLLCFAERGSSGVSTVLRTDDGGATWFVAGTGPWLGSMFTASDATTLWAGANAEAGPVSHPILDVSRDGGRTWQDARLPGLVGQTGGPDRWVVEPPVFVDAASGFVTIFSSDSNGNADTRTYRTVDRGRSWSLVGDQPRQAFAGPAMLDAGHWLVSAVNPFGVVATADGGSSWQVLATRGLPTDGPIDWIGAVDANHAAALVTVDVGLDALYLTADGGTNWQPADFGSATSAAPSPAGAVMCNPRDISMSVTGWGPAMGTMYAVLRATLVGLEPCQLPTAPAVEIVDAKGVVIVRALGPGPETALLTSVVDLRLGWFSWCGPPPSGSLTVKLTLLTGVVTAMLPAGLVASCQGVPTGLFIEPIVPYNPSSP